MILFVDDEKRRMESYVEELGFSEYVEFKSDVDSAIEFFEENQEKIKLLILDIMMPLGKVFKNVDTECGLRTGIRFYERIREQHPTLAIIVFTNVSDEAVAEKIRKNPKSLFLQKENFLPFELAEEVKKVLENE